MAANQEGGKNSGVEEVEEKDEFFTYVTRSKAILESVVTHYNRKE